MKKALLDGAETAFVSGSNSTADERVERMRARSTITDREDVRGARNAKGLVDHQLVNAVLLEAVQPFEKGRPAHACAPNLDLGIDHVAALGLHLILSDGYHLLAGQDLDPELFQLRVGSVLKSGRQRRQHIGGGLDQGDADIFFRVDPIEAIGDEAACGAMKLGCKLDSGRSGTDDRDVQLPRFEWPLLHLRAQKFTQQTLLQLIRLMMIVQKDTMLLDAFNVEIIGRAANGDDQAVIGERSSRHDLLAILIQHRCQADFFCDAIQPFHLTLDEAEMMLLRMAEIVDAVTIRGERAGGDLMQERLPDMFSA